MKRRRIGNAHFGPFPQFSVLLIIIQKNRRKIGNAHFGLFPQFSGLVDGLRRVPRAELLDRLRKKRKQGEGYGMKRR